MGWDFRIPLPLTESHDSGTRLPHVSSLCTFRDPRATRATFSSRIGNVLRSGHGQGPVEKILVQGGVPEGFLEGRGETGACSAAVWNSALLFRPMCLSHQPAAAFGASHVGPLHLKYNPAIGKQGGSLMFRFQFRALRR